MFTFAAVVFSIAKLPRTTSNEKLEKSPKALYSLLLIGVIFLPVLFADAINDATGIAKSVVIISCLVAILAVLFAALF